MTLNKQHFLYTILGAVITAAFGVLLLAVPGIIDRICLYGGGLFCAVGVILFIVWLIKKRQNPTHLIYGIVCILLGVLLCIIPSLLNFLIPILFGLWILGSGGFGLFKNLMNRSEHKLWWLGSLLCLAAIALGVIVITRPADAMQTTISFIGIAMIGNALLRPHSDILGRRVNLKNPHPSQVIETPLQE